MRNSRYHVTKLYDEGGNVSPHFLDEEFYSFCPSWETAMANPGFAAVIERELQAESIAEAPLGHLAALAPNERVRAIFTDWLAFIDDELEPWTTGGAIHFRPHWARVLMHALAIGDARELPDADLRALAMAAVFHDSRRKNPYLDTGHGARAAAYYAEYCCDSRSAAQTRAVRLAFDPRTMLAIAWHDRDDEQGLAAVAQAAADGESHDFNGVSYQAALPDDALADAATILRIFKDADGLDRVRLGDGGLDTRYLRTDQARANVDFAHALLAASEREGNERGNHPPTGAIASR